MSIYVNKLRVCVKCEEEFDPTLPHNKKGLINVCGACTGRDVPRYVGMRDNAAKSGSALNIFRSPTAISQAASVLQAQNRAGFNANIGLGSTTSTFGESADI